MTYDVVALVRQPPDVRGLVDAMVRAGADLKVRGGGDGAVIQLCDARGRPLLGIEAAQRVEAAGEVERLLGAETAARMPDPCWWVEARAADTDADTVALAHRFADGLVDRLGGTVWSGGAGLHGRPVEGHGTVTPAPPAKPVNGHPAIDAMTVKAAVAVQDRPVVPLTTWLADAVVACERSGRGLQVRTAAESRVTLPLRALLNRSEARWVVEEPDGGGHYDGFSGVPLVWDDTAGYVIAADAATAGPSRTFLDAPPDPGSQLLVDLRLLHPAAADLVIGGAVETIGTALTGTGPAGWGVSEPALSAWNPVTVTELCRRRAPQATLSVFAGPGGSTRGFVGTHRVSRVTSGVKETITAAIGYRDGEEPPIGALQDLARGFADRGSLLTMTVQRVAGRPDLTYTPHWYGIPTPVGIAVGGRGVAEIGLSAALAAPVEGHTLGRENAPSVWYPLGDGTEPDASARFAALMAHLSPEGSPRAG
ncbi:DUF6177 family protein [Nocardiopsis sediminis]|uniref:DUF6177 family protein n=1 Tax=Nocardiopsis sediminis TaxID=1778267 RepID=A0ABV8FLL3_9ACTN